MDDSDDIGSQHGPKILKYPPQVYLILGNEICERFSYYGLHTILLLFLTTMHKLKRDTSISIYHGFNMLCYMSPLLGAIISDSFIGRFRTILYLSIVYAIGSIILATTAIPDAIKSIGLVGTLVGLFFIALGTGGIKPCVSTFGADQFNASDEKSIQSYFSVFYFAINLGSLVSMIVTPILRSDVQCFGEDCYFLAFGVPAILMVFSILLFLSGINRYKRIDPKENIILLVIKVSATAIKKKIKHIFNKNSSTEDHWIDYAKEDYSIQLLEDVRSLYRVLFLFLPIPVFWTLFDQQGSRWTLQAMEMNGNLGFLGVIKPDQIQAINPVLVLILIPIFEVIIYPLFAKCNLLEKPLTKMTVGMLCAVISFVIAGILQLKMQKLSSFANLPSTGCSHLRMINLMPDTSISITTEQNYFPNITELAPYNATQYYSYNLKPEENITIKFLMDDSYLKSHGYPKYLSVTPSSSGVMEDLSYSYIIGLGSNNTNPVISKMIKDDYIPEYETAKVRILAVNSLNRNRSFTFVEIAEKNMNLTAMEPSDYIRIPYGSHAILINSIYEGVYSFKSGSIYTIIITFPRENNKSVIHVFGDVEPRPISILWQIPQYIFLTSGEVLFAITGLDFAYSSSPKSMKSFITAAWLLTVSTGNFIVIIFEGIKITDNMAIELFIFAGLLFFTTIVFYIMAQHFVPHNPHLDNEIEAFTDEDKLEQTENNK